MKGEGEPARWEAGRDFQAETGGKSKDPQLPQALFQTLGASAHGENVAEKIKICSLNGGRIKFYEETEKGMGRGSLVREGGQGRPFQHCGIWAQG